MIQALVDALIDHHAKQGRTIRITDIKQGKGSIAGCVLIPGPLEIEFEVVEGDAPPPERGVIIADPGEPVRIKPHRQDPWEELIAKEEAEETRTRDPKGLRSPKLRSMQPDDSEVMGLEIPAFVKRP